MTISVLSIFLLACCIPALYKLFGKKTAYALALLPLGIFSWFLSQYSAFETPVKETWSWNPYFHLDLAFHLDGLSWLFSLLITGIGVLIYLYAAYYMKEKPYYARFFIFLTVFMGAMLGLVLADNTLTLIVFWEMTSITSFLLIGYEHEKESSRNAALQGLLVTAMGGLALLAGLVLIGAITDTYRISDLAQHRDVLIEHDLYLPILLCVLLGAFTKSAQVPFHFWLPNAMAAPTPVSAYLHSATMVKAGIYFIARFFPVLGSTPLWEWVLITAGSVTMLTGAIMAFRSDDLKKILAYSTISALGIMVLAFGIGTETAIYAGMAYIVAHALYKSALFMLAGIVDKQAGTRLLSALPANLYQKLPVIFALILAAALSLGGVLPFFGFIAKEMLLEMVLHAPMFTPVLITVMICTGILFVTLLFMLTHQAFFKSSGDSNTEVKKPSFLLYFPPLVAALAGLLFGLFPDVLSPLVSWSAQSLDGNLPTTHLALWHGWNTAFLMSIVSIVAGGGLYYVHRKFTFNLRLGILQIFTPSRIYDLLLSGMLKTAAWQTANIQTGRLRDYVMFTFLTILGLTGFTFFYHACIQVNTSAIDVYFFEIVMGIIILLALWFILAVRSNIGALLSLGIIGIVISIIFLGYGAPDLAITFFLIDALTITLFVLILHKLPRYMLKKTRWVMYRDALISVGMGALVTLILLAITYHPLDSKLKTYYAENSYTLAKGKNIVNVILVDFRSLDTLGEATVLAIAALGVFAIIHLVNQKKSNPL